MKTPNRRKSVRLNREFPVTLCKDGGECIVPGVSANLSQVGAFVQTSFWRLFEVNDETIVSFLLPPDFTGQDEIICLRGTALVKRIEQMNESIAVEFDKTFKQFQPVRTNYYESSFRS